MHAPEGWLRLNDYAIRAGDFTVCRVRVAEGWRFELWQFREQIEVNLMTIEAAIEIWRRHAIDHPKK